jgi:hypothetical protein
MFVLDDDDEKMSYIGIHIAITRARGTTLADATASLGAVAQLS